MMLPPCVQHWEKVGIYRHPMNCSILFDAYNGIGHEDPAFTNAVPASISDTEKAARAMLDQYLTDLGGAVINAAADTGNGESYWASTESEDGQKARYVRFGKYGLDFGAKTGTSRFVRAMKVIGNYKFPEEPATLTVTPTQVGLTSEAGATAESTVTTNKSSYTVTIEGDGSTWLSVSKAEKQDYIHRFVGEYHGWFAYGDCDRRGRFR